ncbi:D-2-hydroxyacid dehydrogenase [Halospeciosus flavus]|uniref:D-2-hydroxyacid dehydrogenase n=1 Tax=Halospeciosus flavus TaxID=3032283 RepID=UPI003619EAD7
MLDADPVWIHTTQAGVDGFPFDAYESRDIPLTNSAGLHGDSVGETAIGMCFALGRRLHQFARQQTRREWSFPEWDAAFTLRGEPVTVVGLGTIGSAVAERADALGMTVTGVRRSDDPVPGVETLVSPDRLHDAIRDARFVVLAVPLTDETEGLVGPSAFDAMREDAYLVNVARGPVVDQDALVEALEAGEIAGAALDVFEEEPLSEDSPLWGMDDVIVTPHAAVADREFYVRVADRVRENVERLRTGRSLENRVV